MPTLVWKKGVSSLFHHPSKLPNFFTSFPFPILVKHCSTHSSIHLMKLEFRIARLTLQIKANCITGSRIRPGIWWPAGPLRSINCIYPLNKTLVSHRNNISESKINPCHRALWLQSFRYTPPIYNHVTLDLNLAAAINRWFRRLKNQWPA